MAMRIEWDEEKFRSVPSSTCATVAAKFMKRILPRFLFLLTICLWAAACGSPHRIVHHRAGTLPPPRKFVVFMDGTGNDTDTRTNVRRLFETISAQHRPDILTYYDVGVGADWRKITGGAFGWGFSRNVREAAKFVATQYKPGDKIYVFGFSRGAYQAMDFCGFLQTAGIPLNRGGKTKDAVDELYSEYRDAVKRYHKAVGSIESSSAKPKAQLQPLRERLGSINPPIEVLGIWDAVEALGAVDFLRTSFSNSKSAEAKRQRGHKSHWINLGPDIARCYYALSLDEQRQPYMAELPDWNEGQPRHYEFVWFSGDHSDIGGGHDKEKDLAGISFNWMQERVGGDFLPAGSVSPIKVHQNPLGRRHDMPTQNFLMSLPRIRVRGEVFGDNRIKLDEGVEVRPVRSQGWTMSIHESVLNRMAAGNDSSVKPSERDPFGSRGANGARAYESDQGYVNRYVPRPFRQTNGWVTVDFSTDDIRRLFPIVPMRN